jgi:serine/threonine protein kinase
MHRENPLPAKDNEQVIRDKVKAAPRVARQKTFFLTSIQSFMPLTPGTKLGPYEIHSALGAGGMGEVYRANDTRLSRTVAIKVLPSHLSHNGELKQRFEREARAISSLAHPHICTLYDVG